MYKERIITDRVKKLANNFPVVVLTGARQTGKSTLLSHIFPNTEMVVFNSAFDDNEARQDPDLFLENHPSPLILDEIQYAPELVSAIKRWVDKDRKPGSYILTGSQHWSVMKTISESLAGRAVVMNLEGFCLSEITEKYSKRSWLERWIEDDISDFIKSFRKAEYKGTLYELLWRGWLPEADRLDLELIPDFYRSYIQTYVERDARLQADVRDWQEFGKFIQLASALTSQEVNSSKFGREIGINYNTAIKWLIILKATFQWFEVPPYHGNTIKRISKKNKGYISDTGLACSLNMISSHQALSGHPLLGALFETAVVSEIRKLSNAMPSPPGLYHWRSHGGAEVDLILERDGILFPIEIKVKTQPSNKDARGIKAFRETYQNLRIAPGLIICACEKFMKISENDYCMPWNIV